MASTVWVNGRLTDKLTAVINPLDHGLMFGDGVTAGTRLYGGEPFALAAHLVQLATTAAAISLKLPNTPAEFADIVRAAGAASGRSEGYVKIVVTRGAGTLGFDPRKCEPAVIVIVDDLLPYPPELREAGVSVATAKVRRHRGHLPDFGHTLSNLTAVLAMRDALAAGCLEALVLDETGAVTGTTAGAVYFLSGGELRTAPADVCPDPVMAGVVRELAAGMGLVVGECEFVPADVAGADEAFFAGCGTEVVPISRVDGVPVGAGAVSRELQERFRRSRARQEAAGG